MLRSRHFQPLTAAATAAVVALSVPLVLGFLKWLHPAFDSFTHFRAHLAVLLTVISLLLVFSRERAFGLVGLALGLGSFITVLDPSIFQRLAGGTAEASMPTAARYRLLQLNLRYDNRTPKEVLSLIGRSRADVVTLDEVSAMWVQELAFIEDAYPYRIICPEPSYIGGVAILSRRPFLHPSKAECFDRGALAIATINFGGTAVDIAALHLGWPWPFEQTWQTSRVASNLYRLGSTAILAGDFNAVPWSATVQSVAEAGGFTTIRSIGPTWLARPLPNILRRIAGLPIDNLLVKGNVVAIETRRLDEVGSDHLPVLLEFGLLPQPRETGVLQASSAFSPGSTSSR